MSRKGGSYVNNAQNRSLGRVGMSYGSSGGSSSYGGTSSYSTGATSQRTYVDNAANQSMGRVGKPMGSHVRHSDGTTTVSSGASYSSCADAATSSQRTYVDNSQNRRLDRVGQPHGAHVQHKDGSVSISSTAGESQSSVYVDNATNRKLGRVGKPRGSHIVHKNVSVTTSVTPSSTATTSSDKYYVNNPHNRKLGRVGKIIVQRRKKPSKHAIEQNLLNENDLEDILEIMHQLDIRDHDRPAVENAQYDLQRSQVEENWEKSGIPPSTNYTQVSEFIKEIIPISEIKIQKQIGKGGFGEVYAGLWKETPIAFKKLLCQQITATKKRQLVNEIRIFSQLSHTNIVKMFGVVTEEGNIGIVMEYLPTTLFRAIFIEEVEFNWTVKKKLLSEVISAVAYLHSSGIAHCDIKCQNILLDNVNVAKLCDFGLSTVKNSATSMSSASFASAPPGQGTPRYSAPEVLRGELLKLDELKMTDIYSLSLVIYQVLAEEEPFDDLTYQQLVKNVGRENLRPSLDGTDVTEPVKQLLVRGWAKEAARRPDINNFSKAWSEIICQVLEVR